MTPTPLPLIERAAEQSALHAALDRLREGEGSVVLVEGPAGIGKTRLIADALDGAGSSARVLRARGGELEQDFPFGVVRQLFERELVAADEAERGALTAGAAAPAAAALGLEGAPVLQPGSDLGFPVLHGLYWLVANLAAERPLVLAVDDAQWSDAPSARFLAYLAPRVAELQVLLLVGSRPIGSARGLDVAAELAAVPDAVVLRPGGLSVDATAALLAARLGAQASTAFVAACEAATGGNPFLLGELATAVADGDIPADDTGAGQVAELGPATVSRTLLLRVASRAPQAADLAKAVAVLGDDVDLRHAAALAGVDEEQAAAAADALAAGDVLAGGRPLRFVHPIVRAAVYGETGPGERVRMHARAAEILQADGVPAERLVPHLLVAEAAGSPAVFGALVEAAAGALARGAPEVAADCLRRALTEPPPDDGARGQTLAMLGIAELCGGGDMHDGVDRLGESLPLTADPGARTFTRLMLARILWIVESPPAAVALLDEAIADTDPADEEMLVRLRAERFALAIIDPRTCTAAEAALDGVRAPAGDTTAERLVLANLATLRMLRGDDAAAAGDEALRACAGGALLQAEGEGSAPYQQAIYALVLAGHIEEARREIDEAIRAIRAAFRPDDLFVLLSARAMVGWFAGDLAGCEADAREAVNIPGVPDIVLPTGLMWLILARVERGDLDGARAASDRAPASTDLAAHVLYNSLIWARASLAWAQGDSGTALLELDTLAEREAAVRVAAPISAWRPLAVRVHVAREDRARAQSLAEEDEREARRWGAPATVGSALRARGLAMGGDEGIELLQEAVGVLAPSPARMEHARALADLGGALRRAGRRADARPVLQQAMDAARGCGGTALAEQLHEELRLAGAKPRRLQFSGAESLTAAERRVAELAADGMSNREIAEALFVTGKTVENQLGRVYGKLGIGSRRDLAGALTGAPAA